MIELNRSETFPQGIYAPKSQDDETLVFKEAAYETPQPRTRRSGVEMRPTMRKAKDARRAGRAQGVMENQQQGVWRA